MDAFTKKFFNDNFSAASRYLGQSREKLKAIYNRTLGELKPDGNRASITRDKEVPCLLYTSPSPRDRTRSRMPSSA